MQILREDSRLDSHAFSESDGWRDAHTTTTDDTHPMEGATKTCMRCKQELENNQTNFPHGSSWCITCAPPDSDSD